MRVVKVTVRGRVQGVSFRAMMHLIALENGVDGWVRNRSDGSVEALLQGEEESVRRVIEWARVGPPRAKVSSVSEEVLEEYPPQIGFRLID